MGYRVFRQGDFYRHRPPPTSHTQGRRRSPFSRQVGVQARSVSQAGPPEEGLGPARWAARAPEPYEVVEPFPAHVYSSLVL